MMAILQILLILDTGSRDLKCLLQDSDSPFDAPFK